MSWPPIESNQARRFSREEGSRVHPYANPQVRELYRPPSPVISFKQARRFSKEEGIHVQPRQDVEAQNHYRPPSSVKSSKSSKADDKKGSSSKSEIDISVVEVQPEKIPPPPEYPEGGFWGWLTLFGATMGQFAGFGYTNAFGVRRLTATLDFRPDFYVRDFLSDYSPSDIAWIGSVQVFLIFASGIVVGRLFDKGYYTHMVMAAAVLGSFSLFMLSLCQKNHYYQVFLSHGIGWGLSGGLLYLPTLSVLSHYFHKRRAFAMGIASSGAALGATVHPIIINNLIHGSLGFANGVRVSAAIVTIALVLTVVCTRPRLPPKKGGGAIPISTFVRDVPYMLVVLAALLVFCGLFFPTFFIQLNAVTHGVDPNFAFYSISILNGVSIFGRILPGYFVPKFGVFRLMTVFTISAGVIICTMAVVHDLTETTFFAIFVGFFTGGCVGLFAPLLGTMAKDVSEIGVRIGVTSATAGVIALFASPIAGALLTNEFHWTNAILFSGLTYTAGGFCYGIAGYLFSRKKGLSVV